MGPTYPVALVPLYGTEELAEIILRHLRDEYKNENCRIIKVDIVRFSTGDAKAVLEESIRGYDVFLLMDVGNYSCSYEMYGHTNLMSPDEHFQNLKRTISAIGGKAFRLNLISPMLYSSRQDRRNSQESLDCALALRELESLGVKNITAFDVHDIRVSNAIPFTGFDCLFPIYQTLKTVKNNFPDVRFNEEDSIFVSPDLGGTNRNFKYANELQLDMGIFYKRRSAEKMVDGSYKIEVHKYIGPDINGKNVFIVDDIICSGNTILDVARYCKQNGAKRIFVIVTFALFTSGIEAFNEAYSKKEIDAIFITNASYLRDEVKQAPWFKSVDITKYIATYIHSINNGISISSLLDTHKKIHNLTNG
ncbi:MAG: ribose-phosphate diphosphokinase [Treponema sp.]|nr:ribose-phosphate diphosphokinase [Treponema sp.]